MSTPSPHPTLAVPPAIDRPNVRVLAICNIDLMAGILLRPWLQALKQAGYDVHIACAAGPYFHDLAADGIGVHHIPVRRTFNPLANLGAIRAACRLIRSGNFDVINTHSPIGAAVGRIAGLLAGARRIIYTVHGFYFHDDMPALLRKALIAAEWSLARTTTRFMFVSDEDRTTALRTGIVRDPLSATTIYNGVDQRRFHPPADRARAKAELGLPPRPVIGITGRIVREKGYREFLAMAAALTAEGFDLTFLVLGDSLPSDRDRFAPEFFHSVRSAGLAERFVFAGFTPLVDDYLRAMDIFVLPSYREGFPRSILEAMATGLPVVSTDVRGCREAVVHSVTGLIVPPRDPARLAAAVRSLLLDSDLARRMARAGLDRARERYGEQQVRARFVSVFDQLTAQSPS